MSRKLRKFRVGMEMVYNINFDDNTVCKFSKYSGYTNVNSYGRMISIGMIGTFLGISTGFLKRTIAI